MDKIFVYVFFGLLILGIIFFVVNFYKKKQDIEAQSKKGLTGFIYQPFHL